MNHFLYALITLIISLFFILLGVICVLIPWSDSIQSSVIQFLQHNMLPLFLFGVSVIVIGVALASSILFSSRKRYYRIQSTAHPITLSETVIRDYLYTYWKKLFPQHEIPCHVIMKKKKIQVIADLPFIPILEQKSLLEKIEKDLVDMFRDILGYREELDISISFEKEKKDKLINT